MWNENFPKRSEDYDPNSTEQNVSCTLWSTIERLCEAFIMRGTSQTFLPTTKWTELDTGLVNVDTVARHATTVLLTAWNFKILVVLKEFPSARLVVLYRLLFTGVLFRVQVTVGVGSHAVITHLNSACWSGFTVTFPPVMLTVPLSEDGEGELGNVTFKDPTSTTSCVQTLSAFYCYVRMCCMVVKEEKLLYSFNANLHFTAYSPH